MRFKRDGTVSIKRVNGVLTGTEQEEDTHSTVSKDTGASRRRRSGEKGERKRKKERRR
jgi:hypothetical protein